MWAKNVGTKTFRDENDAKETTWGQKPRGSNFGGQLSFYEFNGSEIAQHPEKSVLKLYKDEIERFFKIDPPEGFCWAEKFIKRIVFRN